MILSKSTSHLNNLNQPSFEQGEKPNDPVNSNLSPESFAKGHETRENHFETDDKSCSRQTNDLLYEAKSPAKYVSLILTNERDGTKRRGNWVYPP